MSEVKLFGKMIQLSSNDDVLDPSVSESNSDHNKEEDPSKRPEKILPCPRCKSNETKFCYFNNYNLNQPRHFCKSCQRYWTAGGAVRNVPVGSGRRKTKNTNGCISQENEPLCKKVCHDLSPKMINSYHAPPWYPAQLWSYGVVNEEISESKTRVLVPKTLRIDNQSEAAKSSVWATLGIRHEKGGSIGSNGVFGGFRSKIGEMNSNTNLNSSSVSEGSLVLQANPAAFSRSLRFHESAE